MLADLDIFLDFFVFSASISDGSWILVLSEDKEIYSEIQNIYLYYKNNIKYFNLHIVNSKLYSDGEDSQPSDLKSSALSRYVRIWLSDKGLLKKRIFNYQILNESIPEGFHLLRNKQIGSSQFYPGKYRTCQKMHDNLIYTKKMSLYQPP